MIRVFVADDHDIVRGGLQRLLAEDPEIELCGEASTAVGLVERATREDWDVLILDIDMAGCEGPKTVRILAEVAPRTAVIIFTMYPEDSHAVAYIRNGARAFLNKRRAIHELIDAIRMVRKGHRYVTPDLARYLVQHNVDVEEAPGKIFSPREREVIRHLARGHRAVDIALAMSVSASTVNTYVQRIKEKLGVRSVVEIVEFARDNGLLG